MAITRLSLENVRNHHALDLAPSAHFVLLTGPNGAGKTNILEALSLLAPGRGLRRAPLREVARDVGPGTFAISAQIGDVRLGTGTLPQQVDRRISSINGARKPTLALAEWLSLVWLTPAMDRLFLEGAGGRRNFLDRLVTALDPAHAEYCSRYEAARRERNRLLSDDREPPAAWLDGLEEQLAEHGAAIDRGRRDLVARLTNDQRGDDGPFAAAKLAIDGPAYPDPKALGEALYAGRRADRAAGRTLTGPHRSDLIVHHAGKGQPAERCSTGEQKALLFAIMLAHADLLSRARDRPLIMLFDEVAAHLDRDRRKALFERLRATGSQVWLTGTEPSLFDEICNEADHFTLNMAG